jgi:hypothetical protein
MQDSMYNRMVYGNDGLKAAKLRHCGKTKNVLNFRIIM